MVMMTINGVALMFVESVCKSNLNCILLNFSEQ